MVTLPENIVTDFLYDFDRRYISPQWFSFQPQEDIIESDSHFSDPIPDLTKLDSTIIKRLSDSGWIDESKKNWIKHVTYRTFKHGFRTPIVSNESAVFLGCSHTFGTGLNLEDTFSHKVAKALDLQNINLGCPGASFDYCYRILKTFQLEIKPKFIFCLVPNITRAEFFLSKNFIDSEIVKNHNCVKNLAFNYKVEKDFKTASDKDVSGFKEYAEFYKYYLLNIISTPEMLISNFNRNLDAIKNIGTELNAKVVYITMDSFLKDGVKHHAKYGTARDGFHFGDKFHDILTKDFLDLL